MIRFFLSLCSVLPLKINHFFGALIGNLLYLIGSNAKKVTTQNIEICFPEFTIKERQSLVKKSLIHTGKNLTESGLIWNENFSKNAEYRLVTCIKGAIFDVAVDLRKQSKTYLKYFSIQLDKVNRLSLMIPPGFAHGFQVIEEDSQIVYTHSEEYNKKNEGGISPVDPDIQVQWPLPVIGLSKRDKELPLLKELIKIKAL